MDDLVTHWKTLCFYWENRIVGVEDLERKFELDRKTVVDILLTASVTGFLDHKNNEYMWAFLKKFNQVKN